MIHSVGGFEFMININTADPKEFKFYLGNYKHSHIFFILLIKTALI